MHSMLGLGAIHLAATENVPDELTSRALTHRVQAMKQLNEAISTPPKDQHEADARFAAFMILVFQSAFLPDGLVDFLTMLRGCVLQGGETGTDSEFHGFMEQEHLATMGNRLENSPSLKPIDTEVFDAAMASLNQLEGYCRPGVELLYHALLVEGIRGAYISPKLGMTTSEF
jgi:Fungal specific transcription factor domain